ncbi:MAG: AsmA-like C-terminal region-containing protein, partial [Quisquiliibacterium sp.]
ASLRQKAAKRTATLYTVRKEPAMNSNITSARPAKNVCQYAAFAGQADIVRETQQLHVDVTPDVNAGLASLAYGAMVNPVIGLGSFVAQLALRGPIKQLLHYEYDINGSWDDPQIVERKRPAN